MVVDTDETATQIIRHLNASKGGRVTFIPLNKVKPAHINCPQSDDVVPLLKKLKFQDMYTKAFSQVSVLFSFSFSGFVPFFNKSYYVQVLLISNV